MDDTVGYIDIAGDIKVDGSLTVYEIIEDLKVKDNIITLNYGETGHGVTSGESGFEIDRGTAIDTELIWDELKQFFSLGLKGDQQAIATREDAPLSNNVPFWNDTVKRFDTSTNFIAWDNITPEILLNNDTNIYDILYVKNGLGVGIGIDIPEQILDIDGAIKIGDTDDNIAGSIRYRGTTFQGYNGTSWIELSELNLWSDAGSYIYPNNYNLYAITDEGKVGNGIVTPSHYYQLERNVTNNSAILHGIDINIDELGTNAGTIRGINIDMSGISTGSRYAATFLGANVGILNNVPTYPLDVSGNIRLSGGSYLYFGNGTPPDTNLYRESADKLKTDDNFEVAGSVTILTDLTVSGDLRVNGTETIIHTDILEVKDNMIIVNADETGGGVTAGYAGIEVDRGTLTDYQFIFVEATDTFRIGEVGNLQAVATREDSPQISGVPYWDSINNKFVTHANFIFRNTISGNIEIKDDIDINSVIYTSSGNVGIGNVPSYSLLEIMGNDVAYKGQLSLIDTGNPSTSVASMAFLSGWASDYGSGNTGRLWALGSLNGTSHDIELYNQRVGKIRINNVTSGGSDMVIDTNGKIGINIETPNEQLEISGNLRLGNTDALQFGSDVNLYRVGANILKTDDDLVVAGANGIDCLKILNSGGSLSVEGVTFTTNDISTSGSVSAGQFRSSSLGFTFTGDTTTGLYSSGTGLLEIKSGNVDAITINAGRNVGIGNGNLSISTSSAAELNVGNNVLFKLVSTDDDTSYPGPIMFIKSRLGNQTLSGDNLGMMEWYGRDTNNTSRRAGYFSCVQDGDSGTNFVPCRYLFSTIDLAGNYKYPLKMTNDGFCSFGGGTATEQVLISGRMEMTTTTAPAITTNKLYNISGDLYWNAVKLNTSASGDVVGPASATDNAIARYDLATGKLIKNSAVTIDDSNNIVTAGNVSAATFIASGSSYVFSGDLDTGLFSSGANLLQLKTGNINAISIDTSQNITTVGNLTCGGSGYVLLQDAVELINESTANDANTAGPIIFRKNRSGGATLINDEIGLMEFYGTDTGSVLRRCGYILCSQPGNSGADYVPGRISIYATDNTGVSNRGLLIDNNGYVGVGDIVPWERLHINGRMQMAQLAAPGVTTDKLYNVGGDLYWNAVKLNVGSGGGDVVGPASATGNALVRFDGVTGKLIKNSLWGLDDSGNLSGLGYTASATTFLTSSKFAFNGDINTGMFSGTAGRIDLKSANTTALRIAPTTFDVELSGGGSLTVYNNIITGATYGHVFSGDLTTGMFRPSASTIQLKSAGTPKIQINSSGNITLGSNTTPNSSIMLDGSVQQKYTTITTGTTALTDAHHIIFANTVGGNILLNLPSAAASAGREYLIIKTSASNTLNIGRVGSDLIGGQAIAFELVDNGSRICLISDGGTTWHILSYDWKPRVLAVQTATIVYSLGNFNTALDLDNVNITDMDTLQWIRQATDRITYLGKLTRKFNVNLNYSAYPSLDKKTINLWFIETGTHYTNIKLINGNSGGTSTLATQNINFNFNWTFAPNTDLQFMIREDNNSVMTLTFTKFILSITPI